MSLWQIIQRLLPFVRPYRPLVIATLLLTLVGSLAAQVNPFVLRYIVDNVQGLLDAHEALAAGWPMLAWVSGILLARNSSTPSSPSGRSITARKSASTCRAPCRSRPWARF
ncbi:hypothetical protein GCM10022409_12750 [Hymenobacter glaciei]|uniref:ABC transmembrane type-1 domain-containing protein n=1 Tax=Hymenobacter glaciei TaxID=877209 RepID=A0ABP7TSS8_9BACT